ncbi:MULTISPECIES: type 1 glutamine amidotransferase family protein [Rhodococcus]|uniref:type 1 glutamine amidotransferase family protein n=1 Tax=Rhodococcus TaxID=1827 RepID=UPI000C7B2C6B|nr:MULTISPECIES: type 1 glutamine amidotransferase family protein [Rhodococcus]AUM19148.1 glutamine amidotransferase [Rhodococcus ruber]MCF8784754.1 glutamine amidotransferase [Rhodococcus ruber]UQB72920.1 glutamine amidotransferase [Rhodococcus ruber]WML62811.1 type 1 glutamine amidotransferase family protein [Rhodococcus sp. AH-ZY2]
MIETVHVAVYNTFADWEVGHAIAHINKPLWHKHSGRYTVATVGTTLEPVTTMGGIRILPDTTLDEVRPDNSAMLVLAGNDIWNTEQFTPFADRAREFLEAGVPVAAICGATGGLALAGLLDDRAHTSNAAEFLAGLGYAGGDLYRDEPAVTDRNLITASATAPVEFARAILEHLEVFEPHVLESWFKLYGRRDPAGFYELMAG